MADSLECDMLGRDEFGSKMMELGYSAESIPGHGYPPDKAEKLIVLQRVFTEKFNEWTEDNPDTLTEPDKPIQLQRQNEAI